MMNNETISRIFRQLVLYATTVFITTGVVVLYAEECTVGVAIGAATTDGRPILWKNRDSSFRDNEVAFFIGQKFDFIGVINTDDTTQVWAGINTAGFAVINSESLDLEGDSVDTEGFFMKNALGICASLADFEQLLLQTNQPGRGTKSNFGVIDAFGGGAIYETGNHTFVKFDASNQATAPYGFVVRSNFAMTGQGKAYAHWRYQRAKELFEQAVKSQDLDITYVLQTVARDLQSYEVDPNPLPFKNKQADAPEGFIHTHNCINRHRTACCVVFHGVKLTDDTRLATMWCILGEPICGAAIPLWACAGPVPPEVNGKGKSAINVSIQRYEKRAYPKSDFQQYVDTYALVGGSRGVLTKMLSIEKDILDQTNRELTAWRSFQPDIQIIKEFEFKLAWQLLRALR